MDIIYAVVSLMVGLLLVILRERRYTFDPDGPGILENLVTATIYGGLACLIFGLIIQGIYVFTLDEVLYAIGYRAGAMLIIVVLFERIIKCLKEDD